MPKKAIELERMIQADGWYCVRQAGSHRHYRHPVKPGMVTIPFHPGDLSKYVETAVLKAAGLK